MISLSIEYLNLKITKLLRLNISFVFFFLEIVFLLSKSHSGNGLERIRNRGLQRFLSRLLVYSN